MDDVWRPPAGVSIGAAAVCDNMALVSCAPSRILIALQVRLLADESTSDIMQIESKGIAKDAADLEDVACNLFRTALQ